jgi:hypothetical protein
MGQRETVLTMLEEAAGNGVSSNQFYAACLPRFSARIHELRNAGHTITKEPVEQGHFLYRLVKVSAAPTSVDRESLDDRGADLGQSEAQRAEGAGDLTQVGSRVPSESSTSLGANRSSSPDPQDAAVAEPRQVTDADGSPGRDQSASLLLFDMPARLYEDAA